MTPKEALEIITTLDERLDMNDYMQAVDVLETALTELEELKQEVIARQETENSLTQWVADLTTELKELKRYPTADEVCKAIEKWINENENIEPCEVYYDNVKKSFEVGKYEPSICYKDDEMIWLNWFRLPPHLITLIGRFYEGMEKKDV